MLPLQIPRLQVKLLHAAVGLHMAEVLWSCDVMSEQSVTMGTFGGQAIINILNTTV